jgi:ABC-type oligopeptide transport system substrate-binding subunit
MFFRNFLVDRGAEAANTGKGKIDDVGVKAVNDKTLKVELNNPTPKRPFPRIFKILRRHRVAVRPFRTVTNRKCIGLSVFAYIKGAEAANTGKGKIDDVGVKAVNDKTLKVELNNPFNL